MVLFIDYNKLNTFQIVASSSSFTDAAKKLRRTQSAISQQIALLEEEVGFRLFSRRRSKVFLSPEGKSLLATLKEHFESIDTKIYELREGLEKVAGTIRIGVLMDKSTDFDVVDCIVHFSKEYPDVDFSLSFGTNGEIETKLVNGEIDLGIMIVFRDAASLSRTELRRTSHVLVCTQSRQKSLSRLRPGDLLATERLIDFDENFFCLTPWTKKNYPKLLNTLKSRKPSAIVPDHMESRKMVVSGWGIAILPVHLCEAEFKKEGLAKVYPDSKDLDVGLDIAHLKHRSLRECEKLFVQFASSYDR